MPDTNPPQRPLGPSAPHLSLVPGPTDAALAEGFRAEIISAIEPLLGILTRTKLQGFDVAFQIGHDGTGQSRLMMLKLSKEF